MKDFVVLCRNTNEMSVTINESADGTSNIADKGAVIFENTNKVAKLMEDTKQSSERLRDAMRKFKV